MSGVYRNHRRFSMSVADTITERIPERVPLRSSPDGAQGEWPVASRDAEEPHLAKRTGGNVWVSGGGLLSREMGAQGATTSHFVTAGGGGIRIMIRRYVPLEPGSRGVPMSCAIGGRVSS